MEVKTTSKIRNRFVERHWFTGDWGLGAGNGAPWELLLQDTKATDEKRGAFKTKKNDPSRKSPTGRCGSRLKGDQRVYASLIQRT